MTLALANLPIYFKNQKHRFICGVLWVLNVGKSFKIFETLCRPSKSLARTSGWETSLQAFGRGVFRSWLATVLLDCAQLPSPGLTSVCPGKLFRFRPFAPQPFDLIPGLCGASYQRGSEFTLILSHPIHLARKGKCPMQTEVKVLKSARRRLCLGPAAWSWAKDFIPCRLSARVDNYTTVVFRNTCLVSWGSARIKRDNATWVNSGEEGTSIISCY